LVIAGGVAAYKCLDLIRRLREQGATVRCILTPAGSQFVTPLSVASLSGEKVYTDLFSLTDEAEMGHIQLSRDADLVVVAPATADLIAKMANGIADDLASTALLATDAPVLIAPSMNVEMWNKASTQRNVATIEGDSVLRVGPASGDLACGEEGAGRLAEVPDILASIVQFFDAGAGPLVGKSALVTSGPTHEPIDPVRYIANRSSGKQGHAIAAALQRLGANTTLVTGPTAEADPAGVTVHHVETAEQMLAACTDALPVDAAICAAAVGDWRVAASADQKIKKNGAAPTLEMVENPDILANLSARNKNRPKLVIGFAAETENVVEYAQAKRDRKGCDWIVANDVSDGTGVMGGDENTVHLISDSGARAWPKMSKVRVAEKLADMIAEHLVAGEVKS
jgi:phosphopantothenoylcysteine decarboxylase / phosphopantothenate---cysteine ligase